MSAWEGPGKTDEWFTPKYIFDAMDVRFDLDVAASYRSHVPASESLYANSLSLSWSGFIWMNPPFGGRNAIRPWLDKFIAHGNGVALVPDRTSAPWFQKAARWMDLMLFLSPKVKFEREDGSIGKSPGHGTVLMAIGTKGCCALRNATRLGLLLEHRP